MTPLALAAGWGGAPGGAERVALLLEARAEPNAARASRNEDHWKHIPLHWAQQTNQIDSALRLLQASTDRGAATADVKMVGGLTSLGGSALEGDVSLARLLVERGANVNEPRDSGASPLYGACQEGHVEMVRLLIGAGANIHQVRTASGAMAR